MHKYVFYITYMLMCMWKESCAVRERERERDRQTWHRAELSRY